MDKKTNKEIERMKKEREQLLLVLEQRQQEIDNLRKLGFQQNELLSRIRLILMDLTKDITKHFI